MKKSFLLLAGALLLAGSAMAQHKVVKDAIKSIKPESKSSDLQATISSLQPVLADEVAAKDAATWFAIGKANLCLFDALEVDKTVRKAEVDPATMSEALLAGYDYLEKALALDTVYEIDKKTGEKKLDKNGQPKNKAKYSAEIKTLLQGHLTGFVNAGNDALSAQNFADVVKYFGAFCNKVKTYDPEYPDSTLGQIRFFEGYGAYQVKKYEDAFKAFTQAIKLGYKENSVDEFQFACLGTAVQDYMDAKNYDAGEALIKGAIAEEPANGKYQNLLGIFVENKTGDLTKAVPYFEKAVEMNGNDSEALFNLARYYYNQASEIVKNNPDLSQDELVAKIKPVYDKALPYFEKALELGKTEAKAPLRQIYYILGNEEKYEELSK